MLTLVEKFSQCPLRSARRAGLGRTAFVDFLKRSSVRNRLVLGLVSEGRPGGVIDAFRHPGLGELHSADVTDADVVEPLNDVQSQLVLKISPRVGDFGASPWRTAKPIFRSPIRVSLPAQSPLQSPGGRATY